MRNIFVPILLVGGLVTVSLSLLLMGDMEGTLHDCPFAVVDANAACVQTTGPLALISAHFGFFTRFASALPLTGLLLFGWLWLILQRFRPRLLPIPAVNQTAPLHRPPGLKPVAQNLLIGWLALHENSPAAV